MEIKNRLQKVNGLPLVSSREAGATNTSPLVALDFAHLVPVGSLLLLADLFLSVLHLVCLPADDGGLWRVWPCTRVKTSPRGGLREGCIIPPDTYTDVAGGGGSWANSTNEL